MSPNARGWLFEDLPDSPRFVRYLIIRNNPRRQMRRIILEGRQDIQEDPDPTERLTNPRLCHHDERIHRRGSRRPVTLINRTSVDVKSVSAPHGRTAMTPSSNRKWDAITYSRIHRGMQESDSKTNKLRHLIPVWAHRIQVHVLCQPEEGPVFDLFSPSRRVSTLR